MTRSKQASGGRVVLIAAGAKRWRRSLAALAALTLVSGIGAVFVPVPSANAAGTPYSIDFSAADPPTYVKRQPSQLACPTPSGGTGRAANPLVNAANPTSVESLAPKDLALGQIVPFLALIDVSGSTVADGGTITMTNEWLTKVTNGADFGFDPAYGLYCAFVDTADGDTADSGTAAKVSTFTSTTTGVGGSNEAINGVTTISGLDDGDHIVVEMWVVLKKTIPAGTGGVVQNALLSATSGSATAISVGNQTVPLNQVQTFFSANADLSVTKSDAPDPVIAGQNVTYTLTATNNSTDTVANTVVVTDTLDANTTFVSGSWPSGTCTAAAGVVTCALGALTPGQIVTITIVATVSAGAPNNDTTSNPEAGAAGTSCAATHDLCNIANISAITADSVTTNNHYAQPTNVTPANATINVVKSSTTSSITAAGQSVPYTFTVTNPGNVTLTGVTVTDPNCAAAPSRTGGDTNSDNKLQGTETWTYTCSHTVTQAEVDAGGNLSNTVTADSTESAPDTDTLDIPITRSPAIQVIKSSTTSSITAAGQSVPYSFSVTNTGNVTLTGVTVTDPNCNAAPTRSGGDTNADNKLQLTETWTYTCSRTVTQAEVDAGGNLSNTVTADSVESAPDTDTLNIPITQSAAIIVVKSSTTTSIVSAGQVVPYSFSVTNPGNVTLTGVTVTDPHCTAAPVYVSGDTNSDNKLQVTETWIYTCSRTVTQAEVDAGGNLSNTVTADSVESAPDTDTLNIPVTRSPSINVVKSSTTTSITLAGQVVPYSFSVTNPGNVTLTGVTVTDPNCIATPTRTGGDTNSDNKLQVTETWTYTCSRAVTQAEVDAGGNLSNTVTADSVESLPDTDTLNIPITRSPALTLDKSATEASYAKAGDVLHYSYLVTNTGNTTLTGLTVSDNKATVTCPVTTLAPLAFTTCTATYTVLAADVAAGSVINIAHASSGATNSPTDTVTVPLAALSLDKSGVLDITLVSPIGRADVGDPITYTLLVDNVGNIALTGVTVTDPNCDSAPVYVSGDAGVVGTLETTETWTYTCTHLLTQADIDAGSVANTATADSTESQPSTDTALVPVGQVPQIDVVKSSTTTSITAAGQVVPYSFSVTNPGNITLTGVTVSDPTCDAAPIRTGGDTNSDNKLQTTETWTYTCSRTVTQAEVDAGGNLTNTVTADSVESLPDTDSHSIPITRTPAINVVKTSTTTSITAAGQSVPYTFTVTNIGNVTLTGVTVTDPNCNAAPTRTGGDTNADNKLQLTETWTYTCSHTVTQPEVDAGGNLSNTVTADSVESTPDTDTFNIPITQTPVINVVKHSTTTSITAAGQSVPYTFTVTNTGNTTLTGVTVTDPNCNAAPTRTGGDTNADNKLQLTETWSYTCSHTVTQAEVDAGGNLSNTVTADSVESTPDTDTFNIPIIRTPGLSIDKSATETSYSTVGTVLHYSYLVTNTGNTTLTPVTVTDNKTTATCPALPAGGLAPLGTVTCTATYTVTQADLDAGSVVNIAFASSGNTNSPTDTVTVPAVRLPALTLAKAASPTTYGTVGTTISYTYTVTNSGNVTLTGPFSVSDNKVPVTCPATATLAPHASLTCTASHQITQADIDAGSIVNLATASGGGVTSNQATATVTATQSPSFDLTKTADPASGTIVQPGSTITYTVTYRNTGNVTLGDQLIADALPAGAIFASIADGGTYDVATTTASWHTGGVAPGGTRTVHWTVTVASGMPAGSVIVNIARVGSTPSGETRHTIASGDLTLVKGVSADTASVGSTLVYTLTVTATGSLDQTNVVVTDVVPDGTTYIDGSAAPAELASYDATTRTVTWTIPSLKAGDSVSGLTFSVTVDARPTAADGSRPAGTITNAGSVGSAQTPATPSNTVTTTVPGVIAATPEPQPAQAPPTPAPVGGGVALPFTGASIPLGLVGLVGLTMVGLGSILLMTRRRRLH